VRPKPSVPQVAAVLPPAPLAEAPLALPPAPPAEAPLALPREIWQRGRLWEPGQLGLAPQGLALGEDGLERREPVACEWR
jgi:hypothetical protein